MTKLNGKKIAIVATNGFELSELMEPKKALEEAGAIVEVISQEKGEIIGWHHKDWSDSVFIEKTFDDAVTTDYDGIFLPGGVLNADSLRMDKKAVEFVRQMILSGKPMAAICHGAWTLIETGLVKGRRMTSWPSLKTDLENAGAKWVDEEVVTDKGWVTSRKPEDIPAFNKKMIEEFCEGSHTSRTGAA